MATIRIEPGGGAFDCDEGDTILRAALRAGLGMGYSCNAGACGNCRFELIEGAVEHLRADPPAWSERDRTRHRWLGCQARPKGDCVIKFRQDPGAVSLHRPTRRAAALLSVTPLTRDISEFAFRVEGPDGFRPGQYALLTAPSVAGARAYSMSNLPGEGVWRFLIKRAPGGAATGWLFDHAAPGETLAFDGPYGLGFLREDRPRDLLLLAGGSGLSPMLSILRGARAAGLLADRRLRLFYGCRAEADLFDAGVLGDDVAFRAALSEPSAGWAGPGGLLPDVVRAEIGERLADHEIYFAGPPAMSAAVRKLAHELGAPPDQLHFDEFH